MQDNASSNKRIAKNTIFLYVRMAFVMLVTLYTSRIILQSLGVEDFGVYNVVAGFVSMFAFLNTSLTACIQRFYNYEHGKNGSTGFKKVFVTSFYIQLSLSVIVLALVETIGFWYLNNRLVIPEGRLSAANVLFHASALSMIIVIMQVPYSAAVMAKEKMNFYALVGIIDVLLKLLIVIALQYIPYDRLSTYGLLLVVVSVFDFLLYFIFAKKNFPEIHLSLSFDRSLFKSMLSFSGWSILGSFAQIIRNQGLNVVLNLFFGPVVNAARGISYQVKTAISSFMANVPTAARPQLTEAYAQGDFARSKSIFFSISKICFLLMYIIALPVAYEMDYLLQLWLGDNVPEYTAIFSRIILVIAIVEAFNWPISMIIYASGKIGKYNIVTSLIGIAVLPLSYVALLWRATPIIVYLISLFISVSVQFASLFCMQSAVNIKIVEYCKSVILPSLYVCLLSIMVPYPATLMIQDGFGRLLIVTVLSIIVTLLLGYYLALNHQEKDMVRSIFHKLIKR